MQSKLWPYYEELQLALALYDDPTGKIHLNKFEHLQCSDVKSHVFITKQSMIQNFYKIFGVD